MEKEFRGLFLLILVFSVLFFVLDGLVGLALLLIFYGSILATELVCRSIIRRHISIPRALLIGLPASVVLIVFAILGVAVVKGADEVSAMPRWFWLSIIIYAGNALGLTGRLSASSPNIVKS